ncbi:MAG: glutamine synthetase III [Candidatus Omnitrophota bacterium]|nr:glutamine synthetase III [Candidatus Omnitrophota bacterium]MBU1929729.1 glutamine synthetase III [Candidatus Omnitrophota bacterium]MBU2035127.1 glutamine synthetase III [Candidatus Omnitrophota bacterium]MBU2257782.1 glutamine synthetase III [Candidatus Omnitrophota bacterium]
MGLRQKTLFRIKNVELKKIDHPKKVSSYFGENTFSLETMQKHISKTTFEAFKAWMSEGKTINIKQADEIAAAMKDWAISKGATYYTHWFQPMTGLTAEKHDSFISMAGPGKVIEKFSGNKLIQGEPDASSFPSGGIRATFEARGYTAWDPSSPAFIIESALGKTLCIPTIFISYHGEALDKKLPLLRSDEALNKAATGLLKIFGRKDAQKVFSTCGPEQEYFLIDRNYYNLRQDLLLTGRTLVGAASPKGQQLEDQYFGTIKERVVNFMFEVAEEAYKLGIPVMTRHNEVAPHQYEFAPIFEESNLAADHNQLLMELMKKVALRHNLVCLLHEKPFAGINGSGKHLNWSLADNNGNNLLNPGETPEDNLQFLAVLAAVLRAVYLHGDLLRASVALAGNEHRLGANEAPPAIISVFLGEQLTSILDMIEKGAKSKVSKRDIIDLGIARLPKFNKDSTDRNRTSPFAFTGAKFEFRAVGSSQNIATAIAMINTIIAESLDYVADKVNKAKGSDFSTKVMQVIAQIVKETKDIRFEGNNYAEEWIKEAKKRGLPNVASTIDALKALTEKKNINLFERYKVFSKEELIARHHIWVHMYNLTLEIEANTLNEMVNASIVPAGYEYEKLLAGNLKKIVELLKEAKLKLDPAVISDQKEHLSDVVSKIYYVRRNTKELVKLLEKARGLDNDLRANLYFKELKPLMEHIRRHVDALECVVPDELWELPKYREMLFIK